MDSILGEKKSEKKLACGICDFGHRVNATSRRRGGQRLTQNKPNKQLKEYGTQQKHVRVDRRIFPGCVTSRGGLRFSPIPDTADAFPYHPVDYSACLLHTKRVREVLTFPRLRVNRVWVLIQLLVHSRLRV